MTPYMATRIWVNIGSDNGFLLDGTKPLPEPKLTIHQQGPITFILSREISKEIYQSSITDINLNILLV